MLSNIDFGAVARAIELPDAVLTTVSSTAYSIFGGGADAFDALLNQVAPGPFAYLNNYFAENQHPLAARLPLMKISYVLFALIVYAVALIVLYPVGKVLGKRKHRLLGLVHNCFLFLLSWYMCASIGLTAIAAGYTLWNNAAGVDGEHDWRMAKLIWLFYVSKLPEFVDTFLMMLKQNYRQISFLHLYHHSTIFVIWFIVTNKAPGGEAYWSAMANSGVHVVMYGYYFGTMLFESGPIRNFLNAFKFFITKGQMTQFALNCVQSAYDLNVPVKPNYPTELIHLLFWYMLTLLALFGNFLIKNKNSGKNPAGSPTSPLPQKASKKLR
ncbi:long chain polyunsaturated fatty acid elongation enzyme-like protein, putative [Bodo saltans]|uniref:Elongation of fatty acids protein n=1 Tax=Bodo saltans TaxID=75058 RepID=A0A0S4JCZ3_BODSA|nr:long chain polyunsaturated fatty acid elongation enzyme-like protein, putative [Bodo saltans]|eukprot:CUG87994.1 long chain polyunsaturated fatty acid elongation enzyme-like protein, putative [Bodo saltans]